MFFIAGIANRYSKGSTVAVINSLLKQQQQQQAALAFNLRFKGSQAGQNKLSVQHSKDRRRRGGSGFKVMLATRGVQGQPGLQKITSQIHLT